MLTVLGCGNAARCDDGVGVFVARALLPRARDGVSVFDAGTGGMDVMFRAKGARRLIVVDASRSGTEPGAIYRVPGAELETNYTPGFGLHDFRWEHALAAGRKIFREAFPTDVTVYLIVARSWDFGLELSEPVRAAAARVIAEIGREMDSYVVA